MSITITACGNSTPPADTVIATCSIGSEHYQLFIQTDAAGNTIGVAGSPLSACVSNTACVIVSSGSVVVTNALSASISNVASVVVSSGSMVVTNALSASISNTLTASVIQSSPNTIGNAWPVQLTDTVDSVSVDSSSRLTVQASAVVTNTITASISAGSVALLAGANVIGTASVIQASPNTIANAWPVRLTDTTDGVAVTAASEILTFVNNTASVIVNSGSLIVTNQISASISNATLTVTGSGIEADQYVITEGVTTFDEVGGVYLDTVASLTASQSGIVRMTALRGFHVNIRDASGLQLGVSNASPLFTRLADGTDGAAITAASELLVNVNNIASAIVSSGSVVVTNALSASISGGSVAILAGANVIGTASVIQSTPTGIANAWPVKITDGTDNALVDAASRLLTTACVTNTASVIINSGSVVVTNGLSASISGGSVAILAGANSIGTASVIQGSPAAITNAWPHYLATNTGSVLGMSLSPLAVAADNQRIYFGGSLLLIEDINVSTSTAACVIIKAGCNGFRIVVLAATYTTTGSQNIGWITGSATSALLQSPMGFADRGGMDVNRMPHGLLWRGHSGCALIVTTTSACLVAGNLNYVLAAS